MAAKTELFVVTLHVMTDDNVVEVEVTAKIRATVVITVLQKRVEVEVLKGTVVEFR